MPSLSSAAVAGLAQLLNDERVDPAVKELLLREYPADTNRDLYRVFVEHSWSVAEASVKLAQQVGADVVFVWEAAWLHDIGIKYTHAPGIFCFGDEPYLRHGIIGRKLCEGVGLKRHGLVCERHVGTGISGHDVEAQGLPLPARDMLCVSLEERVICFADQFFSKSTLGVVPLEEVSRRIRRHGEASWSRFQEMNKEFGNLSFLPESKQA